MIKMVSVIPNALCKSWMTCQLQKVVSNTLRPAQELYDKEVTIRKNEVNDTHCPVQEQDDKDVAKGKNGVSDTQCPVQELEDMTVAKGGKQHPPSCAGAV